jgi:hypothetical protein
LDAEDFEADDLEAGALESDDFFESELDEPESEEDFDSDVLLSLLSPLSLLFSRARFRVP